MKAHAQRQNLMIQGLTARTKAVDAAREYSGNGFSFTRRVIALTCVFSIVTIPLLASIFMPAMPINYGWYESTGGFWIFTDPREVMHWITANGMMILPFHTHLMSAIAGMYFGHSSVK